MATSGTRDIAATWTSSGNVGNTLRFYWYQTGQSVAGNYTDIAWQLQLIAGGDGYISSSASKSWSVTIDGQTFSGSNTIGIGSNATKTLASGTKRIGHNSEGKKDFAVSFSQVFNITFNSWVGTVSGSASWGLTTIARATTPSANPTTVTMGNSIAINLPRASTSFLHTLQHDFCAGTWTTFATSATTSATLAVPIGWASRVPNATHASGKIRCLTYNGATLIGEKVIPFSANVPDDILPSVTGINVEETVPGISAQFGGYLQAHSKLKITTSGAGSYGSTIKTYQVNIGSMSYFGNPALTDAVQDSGVITITGIVTDSRGRSASMDKTITVTPYTNPTVRKLSAYRAEVDGTEANEGTSLKCEFDFIFATCNNKNLKSYRIEYRRSGIETWTLAMSGDSYAENRSIVKSGVLNQEYSYEIRITLTDFFKVVRYSVTVGATVFPLAFLPNLKGVGIGGCPTGEQFQVFMAAQFYKTLKLMDVDGNGTNMDLLDTLNTLSSAIHQLNSNLTAANWQDEQQVGTYRGVPLYRKTIITNMSAFTAASTLQVVTIPHGISGVAKIIKSEAVFGRPELMYTNFFTTPTGAWETFLFSTSPTNVIFRNKATWGSTYELHITIHYTKL